MIKAGGIRGAGRVMSRAMEGVRSSATGNRQIIVIRLDYNIVGIPNFSADSNSIAPWKAC